MDVGAVVMPCPQSGQSFAPPAGSPHSGAGPVPGRDRSSSGLNRRHAVRHRHRPEVEHLGPSQRPYPDRNVMARPTKTARTLLQTTALFLGLVARADAESNHVGDGCVSTATARSTTAETHLIPTSDIRGRWICPAGNMGETSCFKGSRLVRNPQTAFVEPGLATSQPTSCPARLPNY